METRALNRFNSKNMISIVIPTLNEEKIIERTLSSLKRLTLPHEIIVSDGGSKDRTAEIARRYADKVIVYAGTTRQNIAMGRNAGAAVATGDYLAFLDADCSIPDPDTFFSHAIASFEKESKLAVLIGWIRVMPEYETFPDMVIMYCLNLYYILLNNLIGIGIGGGEFQLTRTADFIRVGRFNETLAAAEDMDLLYRLSRLGKSRVDGKLLVFHTGRRAHKVGWPKLLYTWSANGLSVWLRGKSVSSEWEVVR